MPNTDPVLRARALLGVAQRDGGNVPAARRQLLAAKLERHIKEVVAAAPPLTQEQRDRLASLLAGRPV